MNEINEYRKATAEWLGKKLKEFIWDDELFLIPEDSDPIIDDEISFWYPDIDANQQNMIKAELIKQGFTLYIFIEGENEVWIRLVHVRKNIHIDTMDDSGLACESEFIAFRKAFMEFYETLKKQTS